MTIRVDEKYHSVLLKELRYPYHCPQCNKDMYFVHIIDSIGVYCDYCNAIYNLLEDYGYMNIAQPFCYQKRRPHHEKK